MSISGIDITARKAYTEFTLDIAQTIPLGGCTAVFGPSGAGKSTLLRLIAGFLRPDSGRINVGESVWFDGATGAFVPAYKRPVGTVFQEGRLFPHLTVEKNLLYADRRNEGDGRYALGDIVDAFDLGPFLARRPETLSGGERQRAALARTMLTRPKLLLLDEPLSALDRGRKAEILPYLENLDSRFGAPAIYVSHNVDEILRVADQTVLLKAGRVEAIGDTASVLNAYGADSSDIGGGAVVTGKVIDHDQRFRLTRVQIGDGVISLPINEAKPKDEPVNIRIDARNVAVATRPPDNISIRNVLSAEIASIEKVDRSPFVDIELRIGEARLMSQITLAACEDLALAPGQSVYALVKTASFDL